MLCSHAGPLSLVAVLAAEYQVIQMQRCEEAGKAWLCTAVFIATE